MPYLLYLLVRKGVTQLAIYALALSRRTGVPVKAMKCAWFDERDYFECNDLVSTTPQFAMRR
jgi:hypothetical protein